MDFIYPFFIAFGLIFVSELGDKTQLLVLSFSSKLKTVSILIGVALGSFFSHGIAILFGSALGNLDNTFLHSFFQLTTYISFLVFGVLTLISNSNDDSSDKKTGILHRISNLNIGYVFIIAFSIAVGEIGDKTFLASLGLGIGYPNFKFSLVLGAICGMVVSDYLAILFGRFLNSKLSSNFMNILSGIIFLIFGFVGLIGFFI